MEVVEPAGGVPVGWTSGPVGGAAGGTKKKKKQQDGGREEGHHLPQKRVKDVELVVPIAYGTISFWLGKRATETKAYQWAVYVRAANNEDLSGVIKKVVFSLHPSFENPTRVVDKAPFELSECGWGEFEITLTIHFHSDATDRPAELTHHLKLYPEAEAAPNPKRPVVSEHYDEIVFPEPGEAFFERVKDSPAVTVSVTGDGAPPSAVEAATRPQIERAGTPPVPDACPADGTLAMVAGKGDGSTLNHPLRPFYLKHSDASELRKLTEAKEQVAARMEKLENAVVAVEEEIAQLRSQLVDGPVSV